MCDPGACGVFDWEDTPGDDAFNEELFAVLQQAESAVSRKSTSKGHETGATTQTFGLPGPQARPLQKQHGPSEAESFISICAYPDSSRGDPPGQGGREVDQGHVSGGAPHSHPAMELAGSAVPSVHPSLNPKENQPAKIWSPSQVRALFTTPLAKINQAMRAQQQVPLSREGVMASCAPFSTAISPPSMANVATAFSPHRSHHYSGDGAHMVGIAGAKTCRNDAPGEHPHKRARHCGPQGYHPDHPPGFASPLHRAPARPGPTYPTSPNINNTASYSRHQNPHWPTLEGGSLHRQELDSEARNHPSTNQDKRSAHSDRENYYQEDSRAQISNLSGFRRPLHLERGSKRAGAVPQDGSVSRSGSGAADCSAPPFAHSSLHPQGPHPDATTHASAGQAVRQEACGNYPSFNSAPFHRHPPSWDPNGAAPQESRGFNGVAPASFHPSPLGACQETAAARQPAPPADLGPRGRVRGPPSPAQNGGNLAWQAPGRPADESKAPAAGAWQGRGEGGGERAGRESEMADFDDGDDFLPVPGARRYSGGHGGGGRPDRAHGGSSGSVPGQVRVFVAVDAMVLLLVLVRGWWKTRLRLGFLGVHVGGA
jgi:hypothetical protein